jgi:hypothetical protein
MQLSEQLVYAKWTDRTDFQASHVMLEVTNFMYGFLCRYLTGLSTDTFTVSVSNAPVQSSTDTSVDT